MAFSQCDYMDYALKIIISLLITKFNLTWCEVDNVVLFTKCFDHESKQRLLFTTSNHSTVKQQDVAC